TQEHHEALERAEVEYQRRLNELLSQRARAEHQESLRVDQAVKGRLATALDALTAPPVPEDRTAADAAHAALRARVDPALKAARAVRADLNEFWREYGSMLSRLQQMDRSELLRDLPMAADHAVR